MTSTPFVAQVGTRTFTTPGLGCETLTTIVIRSDSGNRVRISNPAPTSGHSSFDGMNRLT